MNAPFKLYASQYTIVKQLSIEEKAELLDALFSYHYDSIQAPLSRPVEIAFSVFREQFKKDKIKNERICYRNKNNIKKRWEKKDTEHTVIIGGTGNTSGTSSINNTQPKPPAQRGGQFYVSTSGHADLVV